MVGFTGIFDIGKIIGRTSGRRQVARCKRIVNSFKDKLVKLIKDVTSKFDDYSISPKIRQISLGLWITWEWFAMIFFFVHIKISLCWLNRQELLQKNQMINIIIMVVKNVAEYYIANKNVIEEKSRNK